MRNLILILFIALISGCVSLPRQPFDVHEGAVRYTNLAGGRYQVTGADVKTFQHVGGIYGKDAARVYYAYKAVEGADPISFQYIGGDAGRDVRAVYVSGESCPDCDLASFRHLDGNWYADKSFVYEGTRRRTDIDQMTFTPFNSWFAKDKNNVFLSGRVIPGADAESFKLASCGICEVCGEDKNRCYWFDKAVPCDCKPHSGADFPSSFWEMTPGKARIISRGFKNAVHVVTIDGRPEKASLNAELDAGHHVLGLKCPDLGDNATGIATMTVKAGRVYTLKPHDDKACEAHLEEYGIVRGKTYGPQISINNVPFESGRKVPASGVIEAKLLPGNYALSVSCRDVRRDSVREASTVVEIRVEPMHFYQLDAYFNTDACDARVIASEPL